MSTSLTSSAPKLATWLSLFDRLAQQTNPGQVAGVTEDQFLTMCAVQGLAPTSKQVRAVLAHHRDQIQAVPQGLQPNDHFEPWDRPDVVELEKNRALLSAEAAAENALDRKSWKLINLTFWGGLMVGGILGEMLFLRDFIHSVHSGLHSGHLILSLANTISGVFFNFLFPSLIGGLTSFFVIGVSSLRRYSRAHKKEHQVAISIKDDLAAQGHDAATAFSDYTPSIYDMKRWLGCPATVAALRWIKQSRVPLLHLDAKHLNDLVKAMEDEQKKQTDAQEYAEMQAIWTDLVGLD